MKVNKFEHQDEWGNWVCLYVTKHSNKPFKSGKLTERVVEYTTNPHSGKAGFKLADGSIVDCHQVKLVDISPAFKLVLAYNEYITTFIDTDNVGIGMTMADVVEWFHKQDVNDTMVLTVPDIRNKLSPISNLIALIERTLSVNTLEYEVYIKEAIEQSKKSIEYLAKK